MAPNRSENTTQLDVSDSPEVGVTGRVASWQNTNAVSRTRIDPPHETDESARISEAVEQSPAAILIPDEAVSEQIRLQAAQLAAHLRSRQEEMDRREAELNSRIARFESDARAARLWGDQREIELASRNEELGKREREVERRLDRLAAAEAFQREHVPVPVEVPAEEIAKAKELQEQLSADRRALAEEAVEIREQMAAEHHQALADLEERRQSVERRAEHVDQCSAALKQLRAELGVMHRETLEIRLATEELWAQLSGVAPPASLTQSIGRIRTKLAEQNAQANAELVEQKKELEAIRGQLIAQHEKLVEHKRQIEQWAAGCQEDCRQQASRLVAREEQLHDEAIQLRQQSQRWQAERLRYQHELHRLQSQIVVGDESAVHA